MPSEVKMKRYKASESEKFIEEKVNTISKGIIKKVRLCNGCKSPLSRTLDRNICPFCGIRN